MVLCGLKRLGPTLHIIVWIAEFRDRVTAWSGGVHALQFF
jgi:hypothetical protein